MVKSVGVTGTRETLSNPQQHAFFDTVLQFIRQGATEVHHGACVGADAFIHFHFINQPNVWVHVHPPTNTQYSAMLQLQRGVRRVDYEPKTYADRNGDIVEAGDVLVAAPRFPEKDERSKRSGTWMTVRKGKAAGKLVLIVDYEDGNVWKYYDPEGESETEATPAA